MRKKTCTLARVWRQRCSCCHNCSEHNNRNCPAVSGKITPAEVAGSTWGSVCVPGTCPRRQWAGRRRQQASSNFRLTASLLKRPFASAANTTSERSVSQLKHRKCYDKKRTAGCRAKSIQSVRFNGHTVVVTRYSLAAEVQGLGAIGVGAGGQGIGPPLLGLGDNPPHFLWCAGKLILML